MSSASTQPLKKRPRRTPYPHVFRLLHWMLGTSVVVMVLTGLSLLAVSQGAGFLPGRLLPGTLPAYFWSGSVHVVHRCVAVLFAASLVTVLWVYSRRTVRRRATHVALLGGGLAMIASGLALISPVGPPVMNVVAQTVHVVVGLTVVPIAFAWHVADGLGRFRRALVAAFHPWAQPRWRRVLWIAPVLLVFACLVLEGLPMRRASRDLVVRRTNETLNGVTDMAALPWNEAPPLCIELANGTGLHYGRTSVTLRAFHDGSQLYLLAEWLDPKEDRQYMPWKRAGDGWRLMMTDWEDETVHYEDKFALAFPTRDDAKFERFGCATYCHLGGGRAYGYKGSRDPVDVWHWKATRTDPVGQVDDKYWWTINFAEPEVARHGDPKHGGGYVKNYTKDLTRPLFLPDHPSAVRQGVIPTERAVQYTQEAASKIPPGTIVPGIVTSAVLGDRGDIRCQSSYHSGRWRLLIRRKLDTGSPYDVKFLPGRAYPFGCAAFDHTSKRHAYSLSVHRLVLEP